MSGRDLYDILVTDLEDDFETAVNSQDMEKIQRLINDANDIRNGEKPHWCQDLPDDLFFLKKQAS